MGKPSQQTILFFFSVQHVFSLVGILSRVLSLSSVVLSRSIQNGLAILIQLQLGDNNIARVNSNLNRLPIVSLPLNLFHINHESSSVHRGNLGTALSRLLRSSHNLNLVILANRHGTSSVLLSQFLGQGSRQQNPSLVTGSTEVELARLTSRRGNSLVELHDPLIQCKKSPC